MRKTEQIYKLYSSLGGIEQSKNIAEIDLGALRQNYRGLLDTVKRQNEKTKVIAVVKAEAYGHGAVECVRALLCEGCDFFAVSCINEAVAVREACQDAQKDAQILILGYTNPSLAYRLASLDVIQTLLSEDYARRLQEAAEKEGVSVRAHVALDTGMNRIGFPAHSDEEIAETVRAILDANTFSNLSIEGMFTHFSSADGLPNEACEQNTVRQLDRYRAVRASLEERGVFLPFHHACNSAATLFCKDAYFDGVRIGILLFGAGLAPKCPVPLRPVLKLKTVISHLHKLLPGESVSYGGTFQASTERTIATVPIGYADGFLRGYSGCIATVETAAGEKKAPIVGRICMDQCMLDVTDTGAKIGDSVVFFGKTGEELSAYAQSAGTIDYECLCLISSRVPRRYVGAEEPTQTDCSKKPEGGWNACP